MYHRRLLSLITPAIWFKYYTPKIWRRIETKNDGGWKMYLRLQTWRHFKISKIYVKFQGHILYHTFIYIYIRIYIYIISYIFSRAQRTIPDAFAFSSSLVKRRWSASWRCRGEPTHGEGPRAGVKGYLDDECFLEKNYPKIMLQMVRYGRMLKLWWNCTIDMYDAVRGSHYLH